MLHLLGADADTYMYASQYYTYLALGSTFIIVAYTPINQLRSEGFSKASMVGSILGAVVKYTCRRISFKLSFDRRDIESVWIWRL